MDEDFIEELGSGRDVKQAVALAAARAVDGVEFFREGTVASLVGELGLVIGNRFDEGIPHAFVVARARDLAVDVGKPGAELGVGFLPAGEADDSHAGRQFAIHREIVERGDELAVREVTRGTEDHNGAGLGQRSGDEVFAEGIAHELGGSFGQAASGGKAKSRPPPQKQFMRDMCRAHRNFKD